MLVLKILLLITCGLIAFQDFKDRSVYWILFPLMGILLAAICLYQMPLASYLTLILMNCVMVSTILGILFLYTKFIAKKEFLNVSFGLGDLLFFYAFALGYPTFTFILLFVGAIFFSLIVFVVTRKQRKTDTVPLAGLMGLFLMAVTLASALPNVPSLYMI